MHPETAARLENPDHPVTRMICGLTKMKTKVDPSDRSLSACIRRVFADTGNSAAFIDLGYALWEEEGPQRDMVRGVMRVLYKIAVSTS
jgi:hypothetical protein